MGFSALDKTSEQEALAGRVLTPGLSRPKVAAVGCGQWGRNIVRNLSQLGALSAVSDLCHNTASEFSSRFEVPARRFEELLEDDDIEAVAIATPAAPHLVQSAATRSRLDYRG